MLEVLVLAIALSMDAFAVAIGLGSKEKQHIASLAIKAAIYFGVFQGLMPLIGYLGGKGALSVIDGYAHWVAFLLLLLIGVKMIYESISERIEDDFKHITNRVMFMLAIATSIDAMAAGFSLTLSNQNPFVACALIAIVTFGFSWLGVFIGHKSGTWLENKAECVGGVVLILLAFKILLI
ncbi:manganese efflux pump [Pseudoalteromonas sp. JBTF-M23]|uniref:Putative manganese efflux pump MntP n=1 Tax=Pseudoalteromonas caenipelagi TaxID=2726988 RepID=A0A849V998_9GAMM|nr:manganese efflux pump MntP family protein [Pseudoalteromonas caenipelagi]NOU49213.1 manganese efflux pump [Pseudoalteromonas caenipelagi]